MKQKNLSDVRAVLEYLLEHDHEFGRHNFFLCHRITEIEDDGRNDAYVDVDTAMDAKAFIQQKILPYDTLYNYYVRVDRPLNGPYPKLDSPEWEEIRRGYLRKWIAELS